MESLAARAALNALQLACIDPFISLSHSFPWAAAATAPHPIAIDIETRRPFPEKVPDYFTQKPEQELYEQKKNILARLVR
jgi:phosphopantetheinyl transferase